MRRTSHRRRSAYSRANQKAVTIPGTTQAAWTLYQNILAPGAALMTCRAAANSQITLKHADAMKGTAPCTERLGQLRSTSPAEIIAAAMPAQKFGV